MARAEKQTVLTLEERLELALVPDWEQPYKVPENWVWTKLASVLTEIKNGTTVKQDKSGEGYSVTRIESLQHNTIDFDRLGTIIDEFQIKETDWYIAGDVALSHINSVEHVGKTALISEDMLPLVHGMNLLRLRFNKACLPILFQYYSQSFQYKTEIISRINMAVNQVSINQKQLGTLEIPLPPLAEQQRIVDRIESLFAKLDEAKEKAQAALDSFESRKAAILHQAFTGEFTAKWRKKHGVGMETWKAGALIEYLIEKPRNGYSPTPVNHPTKVKSMTLSATTSGVFLPEYFKYIDEDIPSDSHLWLNPGDILIQRANSLEKVGTSAIFTGEKNEFIYPDLMMKLQVNFRALSKFIVYLLKTDAVLQYFRSNATGTAGNMPKINQKVVANTPVVVPTIPEQQEIVCMLDGFFDKEQQAKEAVAAILERINLIKKSILARAFRGELGTNDPTEESAVELLKQCLAQKASEPIQASKKDRMPAVVLSDEVRSQLSSKLERDIYLLLQKNGPSNMRDIASISKKALDVIEALRQLESKGLIQKQSDGDYGCVR